MPVAYLDAVGGLAGDMWLAALLDAGLPLERIEDILAQLPGSPVLEVQKVKRSGLSGLNLRLVPRSSGPFPTRLQEIVDLIQGLDLPSSVKERAKKAFFLLFEAEAKVHGSSLYEVHLHELASYDTLAEIVAVAYGVELLGIREIWTGPLPLGPGLIQGDHGPIPLPAPAVLELLKGYAVYGLSETGETITPTGAVLLKVLGVRQGPLPLMKITQLGVGAGLRTFKTRPNILRLFVGEQADRKGLLWETILELEADFDDQSPEVLAYAADKLRQEGALDVGFVPFFMKKGRAGVKIKVLARPEQGEALAELLLKETGSLGVRVRETRRLVVSREIREIKTPWGKVRVKVARLPEGLRYKPEFEDVCSLAKRHDLSLPDLYRRLWAYLEDIFSDPISSDNHDKDRGPRDKNF